MNTKEQRERISDFLRDFQLCSGLGEEGGEACTIAAINLALTGALTDDIPSCVCPVIGAWVIRIQDSIPSSMRNSPEWRALVPRLAGTANPAYAAKRLTMMQVWLWETALPVFQPRADLYGYGAQWNEMLRLRTVDSTRFLQGKSPSARIALQLAINPAPATSMEDQAVEAARGIAVLLDDDDRRGLTTALWYEADPTSFLAHLISVYERGTEIHIPLDTIIP